MGTTRDVAVRKLSRGEIMRPSSPRRDAERDHVMRTIFSKPGFAADIARHLKCSHANVAAWNRVPPHHVQTISMLTGMSPEKIRPDIFGNGKRKRGT